MGAGTPNRDRNSCRTGTSRRRTVMKSLDGLGLKGCTRLVGNDGICEAWERVGYRIVFFFLPCRFEYVVCSICREYYIFYLYDTTMLMYCIQVVRALVIRDVIIVCIMYTDSILSTLHQFKTFVFLFLCTLD